MPSLAMDGPDGLDGLLLVPPDRNQILGRASWKARYVVVSRLPSNHRDASHTSPGRSRGSLPKSSSRTPTDGHYYLSVYKTKDDWDPIQQWPTTCVTDCQVQMVSHRRQGPSLPTLVVTISDKERRRRSNRAAGFVSANKESGITTLWFRPMPDLHQPSLHHWAHFILSRRGPGDGSIASAASSPPSVDTSDSFPPSASRSRALQLNQQSAPPSAAPRDRRPTFASESLSLRSRRSDVSSPSSYTNYYPSQSLPQALPEHQRQAYYQSDARHHPDAAADGWPSNQRWASGMPSPPLPRDGVDSPTPPPPAYDAASPPAPGETILDRAFQLGHIPGAEYHVPGQEKLSSIARFDALMREVDGRRIGRDDSRHYHHGPRHHYYQHHPGRPNLHPLHSDEDDANEDDNDDGDNQEQYGDRDGVSDEASSYDDPRRYPRAGPDARDSDEADSQARDENSPAALLISPEAQRALAFIAGGPSRSHQRPAVGRPHVSFYAEAASSSPANSSRSRPRTAHARGGPNTPRAQSTPHIASAAMAMLDAPVSSTSSSSTSRGRLPAAAADADAPRRHSGSSSNKRLSYNDYSKRLSSTSSLLLVQTNASGSSSRASITDADLPIPPASRTDLDPQAAAVASPAADADRRCGWRGSVGLVGGPEPGFL